MVIRLDANRSYKVWMCSLCKSLMVTGRSAPWQAGTGNRRSRYPVMYRCCDRFSLQAGSHCIYALCQVLILPLMRLCIQHSLGYPSFSEGNGSCWILQETLATPPNACAYKKKWCAHRKKKKSWGTSKVDMKTLRVENRESENVVHSKEEQFHPGEKKSKKERR